jgi:hypothetical protein
MYQTPRIQKSTGPLVAAPKIVPLVVSNLVAPMMVPLKASNALMASSANVSTVIPKTIFSLPVPNL